MFKTEPETYEILAMQHIEALNSARLEIFSRKTVYGAYLLGKLRGPSPLRTRPIAKSCPVAFKAKANKDYCSKMQTRHNHEWSRFAEMDIPDDKILIPGV